MTDGFILILLQFLLYDMLFKTNSRKPSGTMKIKTNLQYIPTISADGKAAEFDG